VQIIGTTPQRKQIPTVKRGVKKEKGKKATDGKKEKRGQTGGVHPKTETEIMVTGLEQENSCHERT
jgi:hypothetical protein